MIIRRAKLDDATAIADVHVRSWKAAYPGQIPQGYLDSLHPEDRVEGWQLVLAGTDWPREGVFLLVDGSGSPTAGASAEAGASVETGASGEAESSAEAGASAQAGPPAGAASSGARSSGSESAAAHGTDVELELAEDGDRKGKVVGFSHFCPTRDDDRDPATTGEVTSIYLAPETWGAGYGVALMDVSIDEMVTAGYETASLWALDTNARARRFYEIGGWKPDGAVKTHDWGSFTCIDVRYVLDLRRRQVS
jgi:GNAT superfamily N-acetyltransferase